MLLLENSHLLLAPQIGALDLIGRDQRDGWDGRLPMAKPDFYRASWEVCSPVILRAALVNSREVT